MKNNLLIIGGGVVGLATGYNYLLAHPGHKVAVLEKEAAVAAHQTGRNSGVLHSGIYYRPGSFRAQMCARGKLALETFCEQENIPFDRCGKVIVAVSEDELPGLQTIYERGQANGVRCEMISQERLAEIEPHTAGIAAIHVPDSGIVDYAEVCRHFARLIETMGGSVHLNTKATNIQERPDEVVVESNQGSFNAERLVTCGGLHSDRLADMAHSARDDIKIVPFRGEYYELKPEVHHLCNGLIYPVPDTRFPFLGVHFTRMIQGGVECGPNAVLAFAREGYTWTDVNLGDLLESLGYVGFRRLAAKYWRKGFEEMWRSLNKAAFVKALQRLVPDITAEGLEWAPAGVRAQALKDDGSLLDDFAFADTARTFHVLNAASPSATSCLEVGRHVVAALDQRT
ncbi:MAG: L-2-hydroxyglutarate oxidase [Anaerolineales bacterium]|nr:L-2-hydroxyglutarate oxidase [Anaerolineales bacterium]